MESCVTFDKIKLLIYDLIVSEMWKKNILPLIKNQLSKTSSFRQYIAVYFFFYVIYIFLFYMQIQHEAVICNIIEVIFFHRTAIEAAENYLLEIIDYCYRNIADLV